jgi:colanic acid biosynthesis glycosyl transferase WcaI
LFGRTVTETGWVLLRCWSIPSSQSTLTSRLLENVSFGLTAALCALFTPRPDVIYANTWPILAAGLLVLLSKLRHVPVVMSIQDLYPESLIVQRRLRQDSLLVRAMRWLDGQVVRGCAAVVVISERFAEVYREERQMASRRLHVIPNWADRDLIDVGDSGASFRAQQQIPEGVFLVVYGGNIGQAAGVETVIQALGDARVRHERLCFVAAGEGSRLERCRLLAAKLPGDRVRFHSPWPLEDTSRVLRAADVLVLPTQGQQSLASVPSKLISYLLAARPVIALAQPESDVANVVKQAGCGWVVPPERPDLLAQRIRNVMDLDPHLLDRLGQAGRSYALVHFTREACLPRLIHVLEAASAVSEREESRV